MSAKEPDNDLPGNTRDSDQDFDAGNAPHSDPKHRGSDVASVFSHVDSGGKLKMVDVSDKPISTRSALASGAIKMQASTLKAIRDNSLQKGDVIAVARLAGIMAA